jgi:hypothetical protein
MVMTWQTAITSYPQCLDHGGKSWDRLPVQPHSDGLGASATATL